MRIQVITLFAQAFRPLVELGVTGRAIDAGQVRLKTLNPRDYARRVRCRTDQGSHGARPKRFTLGQKYDPRF